MIKLRLFDYAKLSTIELETRANVVSEYGSEVRNRAFLAGRIAANDLLRSLGIDAKVERDPQKGFPYLNADVGYISIAHTEDVALACWSSSPVGTDLEHSKRELTIDRGKGEHPHYPENATLAFWILQEACGKLFRTGIKRNPPYFLDFDGHPHTIAVEESESFALPMLNPCAWVFAEKDWWVAVACEKSEFNKGFEVEWETK